ncbi:hypothetical protein Mal4_55740 [Maioricimonas rarisocia]|uniref:DUF2007 domain-containing protein n=1 Tax=Maioricimonas rarisocia TaxID=2528026 RepID=A0A517ZFJ7_9PLAN|nr:DUF2007 domain-containing protein [Maioricimonas rarisocia]QDU41209.1 hypothetical protein Mal4_55740 [Maioricimonas rarisocia]
MNNSNPVQIYSAANLQEATLVVQLLSRNGIDAKVVSDSLVTVTGEVPAQLVGVPVWVAAEDEQKARDVIAAFRAERTAGDETPQLFCYHCGTGLAEQVETCPSCGATLDWEEE